MVNKTESAIKQNWSPNMEAPLVSIWCVTFNHERFIANALDGILIQETDFPFEIIVHDDASTDGTASIIRMYEKKYPSIIKAIYETENIFSKHDGSLDKIMRTACRGKYIAFCEGDDCWSYPKKLQMQIDQMEKNADIALTHTDFTSIDENGNLIKRKHYEKFDIISKKERGLISLLKRNHIMTVSVVVRKEVVLSDYYLLCPLTYDYALFMTAACMGQIKYIPTKTCCYRKVSSSLTNSNRSVLNNEMKQVYYYFVNLFLGGRIKTSFNDFVLINIIMMRRLIIHKNIGLFLKLLGRFPVNIIFVPYVFISACCLRVKAFFDKV